MRRPKRRRDVLVVEVGWVAMCLAIAVVGAIGGGRALGVACAPLGVIMCLGSIYVATNQGDVADHYGQYTREVAGYNAHRGNIASALLLRLSPDPERAVRSVAWVIAAMGFIFTVLGIESIAALL